MASLSILTKLNSYSSNKMIAEIPRIHQENYNLQINDELYRRIY